MSIIIPCRNEEKNIGTLLTSLSKSTYPQLEIIVVDDSSSDNTAVVAKSFSQVKVLSAESKPAGWVGKNWACWTGALKAQGELLLFTDADTIHNDGLANAVSFFTLKKADLISAPPFHQCKLWWEKFLGFFHILPLLVTAYGDQPKPGRVFAIGQYMLCTKQSYFKTGGHKAIAQSLVDDIDLATLWMKEGYVYHVMPDFNLYQVQMYSSFKEFLLGWKRLLRLGLQRSSVLATLELLLIFNLFLAARDVKTLGAAAAGILLVALVQRKNGRFYLIGALLVPLNIILFTFITATSLLDVLRAKKIQWKEREYSNSET
ncbi:glycosyltransferase [Bdellovibrio reynosensis]|uniref:Glycosyltransferase n=1 Tax=Bdellovibrio reynosensis TaxID=2835041 RepID=A0ABY4C8M9_9BACT|nr:glycosyltransferase [Bdellovibrio reynosensis]UOF00046.1 glycosyltransferase [Bdellovibrio reynosensis]